MKKISILTLITLFGINSAKSQLKVFNDGHVSVGTTNYGTSTFTVFGAVNTFDYGGINLTIKPNNGGTEIGSSAGVIGWWHSTSGWNLLKLGASSYVSDERLKKDISDVKNDACLQLISGLSPKKFRFKDSVMVDTSFRYGFLAQDVLGVIPEVIDTNENHGAISMDYIQLIPLLTGAIKEQKSSIDSLNQQIKDIQINCCSVQNRMALPPANTDSLLQQIDQLKQELNYLKENCCRSSLSDAQPAEFLSQNIPNPFDGTTTIPFSLFNTYRDCFIKIHTLNGEELKSFRISNKDKQLTVDLQDLRSGIYLYSLICDGKTDRFEKNGFI